MDDPLSNISLNHNHIFSSKLPLQSEFPGFHPSQIWNPMLRSGVVDSQSSSSVPGIMAAPRRSPSRPITDNMLEFDLNNQPRTVGGRLPKPLLPSQHPIHLNSPSEKNYGLQPRRPNLGSNLGSLPSIISASGTTAGPRRSSPRPPVHAKAPTSSKTLRSKSAKSPPDAREKKQQKLSEKQVQNRMPAPLPESRLYTDLLEFDARIDAEASRKAKTIHEVRYSNPSMQRILRIHVFNSFSIKESVRRKYSEVCLGAIEDFSTFVSYAIHRNTP